MRRPLHPLLSSPGRPTGRAGTDAAQQRRPSSPLRRLQSGGTLGLVLAATLALGLLRLAPLSSLLAQRGVAPRAAAVPEAFAFAERARGASQTSAAEVAAAIAAGAAGLGQHAACEAVRSRCAAPFTCLRHLVWTPANVCFSQVVCRRVRLQPAVYCGHAAAPHSGCSGGGCCFCARHHRPGAAGTQPYACCMQAPVT